MATMISKLKIALVFPLVLCIACLNGNAQTTDFRAKAGVKVQKDISKKLTASIEYEHRFDNYLTTFDKALIEPSLSFDLTKYLRVGAEWRFMVDQNLVREIEYKQRAAFYIRGQHSIGDLEFKIRTALQYGFDELTVSSGLVQKLISRNTFEIEYNWFGSKLKPSVSYEFFYHINNANGGIINQWRAKAGTSYRLSKKSDLSLFYLFEKEINVAYPVNAHVFGIGFSHKL
jgi:hypothetical protein